jgi:hypothetical protein
MAKAAKKSGGAKAARKVARDLQPRAAKSRMVSGGARKRSIS